MVNKCYGSVARRTASENDDCRGTDNPSSKLGIVRKNASYCVGVSMCLGPGPGPDVWKMPGTNTTINSRQFCRVLSKRRTPDAGFIPHPGLIILPCSTAVTKSFRSCRPRRPYASYTIHRSRSPRAYRQSCHCPGQSPVESFRGHCAD